LGEKGLPLIHKVEEEIERIWKTEIKTDFLKRRILYYESTLQGAFYHHFRPFIDKYPRLRMFLEYQDPDLKKRYDLIIQKAPKNETWPQQNLWEREIGDYWIVMEFKFNPKLSEREAQRDIRKFQALKKYDATIQRVYFCSIDKNVNLNRYLSYRGSWFEKFYREARGIPEGYNWDFSVLKPEKDY
jgi:hypothetical protein